MEMLIYLLSLIFVFSIICSGLYVSVIAWSVYLLNIKAQSSVTRFNLLRGCQFVLITFHAVASAKLLFSTSTAWWLIGLATAHIVMLLISKLITYKISYNTSIQELKTANH